MAEVAVIGRGIEIKGDVAASVDLIVEGGVEGRIEVDRHVTIQPDAVVQAELEVARLTVHGRVTGAMVVRDGVCLSGSARVVGEVKTPSFVMEDGAAFSGKLIMDVGIPDEV